METQTIFGRVSTLLRKWYLIINKLRNQAWPHPARTGCIVIRKLSRERADIVREHVIAVIGADGGEGDIVQDDLGDIAERCLMKFEFLTLVQRKRRFKTSVSKRPSVEIPRLERGLSEPKSLVLPLHHTSIHLGKDRINFPFRQKYFAQDA